MARPWRLRHKLVLLLGLVLAAVGTLLAGTWYGLTAYRGTVDVTRDKAAELQIVFQLQAAVGWATGGNPELKKESDETPLDFERRQDVTLPECLEMVAGKTGALMRCSTAIGAIAVDAPQEAVAELAAFGEHLGMAFQLVDDLLGIWGSPAVTGKPRMTDLASRKKSVPVVAALDSGTDAGERLREMYFEPDVVDDEERLSRMADLVKLAGGLEWTEAEADSRIRAAESCLLRLDAPASVTEALRATAWFVTRRDR